MLTTVILILAITAVVIPLLTRDIERAVNRRRAVELAAASMRAQLLHGSAYVEATPLPWFGWNLMVLRLEQRAALAVIPPTGHVKIDGNFLS